MPEKVTSLNGLKVTLEYGSYTTGALKGLYVKKSLNQHNYLFLDGRLGGFFYARNLAGNT
ncbi:hypothetical protein ACNHGY_002792 [Yersinia enterocolitica]